MHTDNKLTNHGKEVTNDRRSQVPSVNQSAQLQGATGTLGPKNTGAGSHGVKSTQVSPCTAGAKAPGQVASAVGGMLKTKCKRERSIGADGGETRNATSSASDSDAKGASVLRSKRRCVLEKKQPYSGDEWCSGPETEEDDDKPRTAMHRGGSLADSVKGPSDHMSSGPLPDPEGSGPKTEPPQPSQQLVYVFTTSLANRAAEAIVKGQSNCIILFHQQNVPRSKPNQSHLSERFNSVSEKINSPVASNAKLQSGTPQPSSAGLGGRADGSSQSRTAGVSSNSSIDGAGCLSLPVGTVSPSGSPSVLSAHLQSDAGQRNGSENSYGLSKEQLERRERSLQTLRDLERLFLRSGASEGHGHPPGFNSSLINSNNNPDRSALLENSNNGTNSGNGSCGNLRLPALASVGRMKRYEEPLQFISQVETLGGPALHSLQLDAHQNLPQHPQQQLSSPGVDMGPFLGPEGLTPEQMVWRKLQEEFYLEKRRHQEMQVHKHPQHFRMMSEMNMHGGAMMMRGPPPPYHSKPGEQQWGPANMMGGGMSGNAQMMSMQQEGPPRFLGQMQRGALGRRGFPGAGGELSMECPGPQKIARPGMIWLDDIPNNVGGGGRFHGYPGGPEHFQGDPEQALTQEEMFCLMQKREMQGLPRLELDRLAKLQQHGNFDPKVPGNAGEPHFSHLVMGQSHPSAHPSVGFTGSQQMMPSPGGGHSRRDLVESVLRSNLTINPQMNVQQQQMSQKLREGPGGSGPLGEMFSHAEISQIKAAQNARGNRLMVSGPDGCFDFPNQGLFTGGQMERTHLHQSGPGMFRAEQQSPHQKGATSRLCHLSMAGRLSAADLSPRHRSDPSLSIDLLTSPSMPPPHQLKSPSLNQEPSPCLASPSVPGLKSPAQVPSAGPQPPPPPASGAGTPSSSSIKSPQMPGSSTLVLHSPSASPGHLKSPAVTMGSPGWASPKTALSSPAGPTSGQSLPPRSSSSTPISQPGSMNPFTSSPNSIPPPNPLSLMSQMSKYAIPSSTPLYHDAVKTIASSDDEMLPEQPLLAGVNVGGTMGNPQSSQVGPHSDPQSPMGIRQSQQHLSHEPSGPALPSPNHMGMVAMNPSIMGEGKPEGMGPCHVSPVPHSQVAGFPRIQQPPHGPVHSPIGRMPQNFPQPDEDNVPAQHLHLLSKPHPAQRPPHRPESFAPLPLQDGPDLSEVIRPSHTGIPEFDLSRIIPSDKPSSTLQYFPKSEPHPNPHRGPASQQPAPQHLLKQMSSGPAHVSVTSSNPHLANLQNMMAEQQLPTHPAHVGMRPTLGIPQMGSRNVAPCGGPMCPPGYMMGRTGLAPQQQQQALMANNFLHHPPGPYPGMMSSQQPPHPLMGQQNMAMMQAKQRSMSIPGDHFGSEDPLISPQGLMMAPPHPQAGMVGAHPLRQRGLSLDSPVGYGPGGMANMPF
eukprot:XP_011606921.1 PREDICTED: B-cell CLL/lymphoma 9-like protein [Takifugu rubripes]